MFGEAHWSVSTKETRFNGIPQRIVMKGYSRHNSALIGRKNRAKFENDRISRNGHRIKTTQPNLMILVSFSSAENVWSNDVNKYNTFSSQGTENPPFCFFWDTRYTWLLKYRCSIMLWDKGVEEFFKFIFCSDWKSNCKGMVISLFFWGGGGEGWGVDETHYSDHGS